MNRRRLTSLLAMVAACLLGVGGGFAPRSAHAADGDVITMWDATYVVAPSGVTTVTEKLTYVFNRYDAHGILRGIVVREPWQGGAAQDRTYDVDVVSVTATAGASASYTETVINTTGRGATGANKQLQLRVGSASETLPMGRPITYTLTYTISDALINQGQADELYWDVIPGDALPVQQARVRVQLPKGPLLGATCHAARSGGTGGCAEASRDGTSVTWTASQLAGSSGRILTVGVGAATGTVASTGPTLVRSAQAEARQGMLLGAGAVGASTVASAAGGLLWWRRNGRDERYVGLPPGITPAPGEAARVGHDPKPQIPVAFAPPRITPGEAGLLADGVVDVRDTTATLIDLAVRGVVGINADRRAGTMRVQLRDTSIPVHPHERALLDEVFGAARPGLEVSLSSRGSLTHSHDAVTRTLLKTVAEKAWYRRPPSTLGGLTGIGAILPFVFAAVFVFPGILGVMFSAGMWPLVLVPVAVTLFVIGVKRGRGRRSADGRAVTDQVEGFRTYLATAEAEQLRFEEGEDIFSKYLPWAIIFNLTERWTKLCEELVALGRMPDYQPTWYYGSWYGFGSFDTGYLNDSIATAASPVSTDSSFGSGGSSFDSGGFSGGGGGGGSAGSW